jgi:hypothetical protein
VKKIIPEQSEKSLEEDFSWEEDLSWEKDLSWEDEGEEFGDENKLEKENDTGITLRIIVWTK